MELRHGDKVILKRNMHTHKYDRETGKSYAIPAPVEKEGEFVEMINELYRCRFKTSIGYSYGLFKEDQIRVKE